jgi:dolichol-phosphate mannosyltransferase
VNGAAQALADPASGEDHKQPLLSLVICTLDEAESIGAVLREARAALAGIAHEIIVVDDSADDRTAGAALAADGRVKVLRRAGARGLASAAIHGWDAARGAVLAIMDGDGQHDPHVLRAMLGRLRETGADMVVASRYRTEGPSGLTGRRHWVSRGGTLLTRLMLGVSSSDPLSGLFLFTRDWYRRVRPNLSGVGFKILIDMMASGRRRPRLAEVSTSLRVRIGGTSKLDARIILELAALLVEKRSGGVIPARFCLFAAVGSSGVAVHLAALAAALTILPFWAAQALATFAAMTTNFFLNNLLTFRDRRLGGRALLPGLLTFYASCAGGVLFSEIVGSGLSGLGSPWLVAGIAGAFAAALWNYNAAQGATWRADRARAPAAAPRGRWTLVARPRP